METLETFLARQRAEKDAMGVVLTQSDGALLKAAGLELEGLKALSWHMHPAPLVSVVPLPIGERQKLQAAR